MRHYDASRKICPNIMSKNNWALWNEFKSDLNIYYNNLNPNSNTIIISDNINNFIDNIYIVFFIDIPMMKVKIFGTIK